MEETGFGTALRCLVNDNPRVGYWLALTIHDLQSCSTGRDGRQKDPTQDPWSAQIVEGLADSLNP